MVSEHVCLAPDLNGNSFSHLPRDMMLAVALSCMAFLMLGSFYIQFVESFFMKDVEFCQMFFHIYCDDHMIFIFHSVNVMYQVF